MLRPVAESGSLRAGTNRLTTACYQVGPSATTACALAQHVELTPLGPSKGLGSPTHLGTATKRSYPAAQHWQSPSSQHKQDGPSSASQQQQQQQQQQDDYQGQRAGSSGQCQTPSPDAQLTRLIVESSSTQELAQLLQRGHDKLNHIHLAAAIVRIAKLRNAGEADLGESEPELASDPSSSNSSHSASPQVRVSVSLHSAGSARSGHITRPRVLDVLPMQHAHSNQPVAADALKYSRPTSSSQLLDDLLRHLEAALPACTVRQYANVLWALGSLRHQPPPRLLEAFAVRLTAKKGALLAPASAQELSNMALGLSKLGHSSNALRHSQLQDVQAHAQASHLQPHLQQQHATWPASSAVGVLWAALIARAKDKMSSFGPQELSNIAWAVAHARQDRSLISRAVHAALPMIQSFKGQELSSLLWACATAQCRAEELLSAASSKLVRLAHQGRLNSQDIANSMWAFAKLQYMQRDVLSMLDLVLLPPLSHKPHHKPRSALLVEGFNEEELCQLLHSYAAVRPRQTAGAARVAELLAQRARIGSGYSLSPAAAAMGLWAAAKIQLPCSPAVLQLVQTAAAGAQQLSMQQLSNALWACSRLIGPGSSLVLQQGVEAGALLAQLEQQEQSPGGLAPEQQQRLLLLRASVSRSKAAAAAQQPVQQLFAALYPRLRVVARAARSQAHELLPPAGLAQAYYAMSRLQPNLPGLQDALACAAMVLLRNLGPQEMCIIVSAMAEAKDQNTALLNSIADCASAQTHVMTHLQLSGLVTGFARLRVCHPQLLHSVSKVACEQLHTFRHYELSLLLRAMTLLRWRDKLLLQKAAVLYEGWLQSKLPPAVGQARAQEAAAAAAAAQDGDEPLDRFSALDSAEDVDIPALPAFRALPTPAAPQQQNRPLQAPFGRLPFLDAPQPVIPASYPHPSRDHALHGQMPGMVLEPAMVSSSSWQAYGRIHGSAEVRAALQAQRTARSTARSLFAFAHAGYFHPHLYHAMLGQLMPVLGSLTAPQLARVLWSAVVYARKSKVYYRASVMQLLHAALLPVQRFCKRMGPFHVAIVAWAYARMGVQHAPVFDAVRAHLVRHRQRYSSSTLNAVEWALARGAAPGVTGIAPAGRPAVKAEAATHISKKAAIKPAQPSPQSAAQPAVLVPRHRGKHAAGKQAAGEAHLAPLMATKAETTKAIKPQVAPPQSTAQSSTAQPSMYTAQSPQSSTRLPMAAAMVYTQPAPRVEAKGRVQGLHKERSSPQAKAAAKAARDARVAKARAMRRYFVQLLKTKNDVSAQLRRVNRYNQRMRIKLRRLQDPDPLCIPKPPLPPCILTPQHQPSSRGFLSAMLRVAESSGSNNGKSGQGSAGRGGSSSSGSRRDSRSSGSSSRAPARYGNASSTVQSAWQHPPRHATTSAVNRIHGTFPSSDPISEIDVLSSLSDLELDDALLSGAIGRPGPGGDAGRIELEPRPLPRSPWIPHLVAQGPKP